MSTPFDLAERVSEALGALYRHPAQTLLAWYRYAIYDALLIDQRPSSYAARAWIDVLSARHVLFCWQPYERAGWSTAWLRPADLLDMAEQALEGRRHAADVQRQITRAQALADMAGADPSSAVYPAWCVFEAACRALESAWICRTYAEAPAAPMRRAPALDDASKYAAIAAAGRTTPRSAAALAGRADSLADDPAQLRQTFFWEWWLREAIPQACLLRQAKN